MDEGAREKLFELQNKCWEGEELFEEMDQADLEFIYKKGPTDKPDNYRTIALLSIGYQLMASMIQQMISESMDDRLDPAQFGFRKGKSTSQLIHIYIYIYKITRNSRRGWFIINSNTTGLGKSFRQDTSKKTIRRSPTNRYTRKGGKSNRGYI